MDQGDLDPAFSETHREAEKTIPEPDNLGSTDTTLDERDLRELGNLEVPEQEHIEKPKPGRPTGYWKRIRGDYYLIRSPTKFISKDNVRKQFIRGFRTAIAQAFALEGVRKGSLHHFEEWDQYRKKKWRAFLFAVQHYADLRTAVRKAGEKETKGFKSFNNRFCKTILAAPGSVEAFHIYVELVFGGNQEGLEQRLKIGVRTTSKYDEKGDYWKRLQDYLAGL